MNRQASEESSIFKRFISCSPYKEVADSIQSASPPEPDIICILKDKSAIVFELVEIIDCGLAQRNSSADSLRKVFDARLQGLPYSKGKRVKLSYKNALIYVSFRERLTDKQKEKSILPLIDYLLSLPPETEGQRRFQRNDSLYKGVRWVHIARGAFKGPTFDVEAAGSFTNPILDSVSDKFQKQYKTKANLELLAYYQLQPELPENTWLPELQKFIVKNITASQFRRVWVFSVISGRIIFVHPCL
jgi:hypothetical protein